MKTQLKLISVILLIALTIGTLLLFGGCTDDTSPINVEIVILHPITGEELSKNIGFTYTTTEIRPQTPFVVKFKNKANGELITDEELKPIKNSIRISLTGFERDGITYEVRNKEFWQTEPGNYYYTITFDSLDHNGMYYDKFNQTGKTFEFTVIKGENNEKI